MKHDEVSALISTDNEHAGMACASKIIGVVSEKLNVSAKYVAPDHMHTDLNDALFAALVADDESGGACRNNLRKLRQLISDDDITSREESASSTVGSAA